MFGIGEKRRGKPELSREESLSAKPVLNSLVREERDADGHVILQVPRRDTVMTRTVARVFKMRPYRRITLDELGTFVIQLCDGRHTVDEIVDKFAEEFRLSRREAELAMLEFIRGLARRSVIGLVVEKKGA